MLADLHLPGARPARCLPEGPGIGPAAPVVSTTGRKEQGVARNAIMMSRRGGRGLASA